jgi:hypothetical protein
MTPRRLAATVTAAVLALSTAAVVAAPAGAISDPQVSPAAPAPPHTAISIQTSLVGHVPSGGSVDLSTPGAAFTPTEFADGFQLEGAPGTPERASIRIQGPAGGLSVGTFDLVGTGTPGPGQAYATLVATGGSCDVWQGKLSVLELERDTTGAITRLAADVTGPCAGSVVTTAHLRYASTVGWQGFSAPAMVSLPGTKVAHPSDARTVTYTVSGTQQIGFSGAVMNGAPATPDAGGDFVILSNGCSGYFEPGQSCSITVRAEPQQPGVRQAALTLNDSTGVGMSQVLLTTTAVEDAIGTYYPLPVKRLLDTRTTNGAHARAFAPQEAFKLAVANRGGVPASGVAGVVLNLTAVAPTTSTYLSVYPGTTRPAASSLNVPAQATRANLVTVPLASDGSVTIHNYAGSVHVVADVMGYYAASDSLRATKGMGSQFYTVDATRIFDSRDDGFPLYPNEVITLGADFSGDGPDDRDANQRVRALAVNITMVSPTSGGHLVAWKGDVAPPGSSTVNFAKGQIVPNMAIVPTLLDSTYQVPTFAVKNVSGGTGHVLVDVVGVYDQGSASGLRYRPLKPTRIIDTRNGSAPDKPLGGTETRAFSAPASVAGDDTWALVANTTAVAPTRRTYLTVWADETGVTKPVASNLNAFAGEVVANATLTPMGPLNGFKIYNDAGSTNTVMDVSGSFEIYPSYAVWQTASPTARKSLGEAAPSPRDATEPRISRPAPKPVALRR